MTPPTERLCVHTLPRLLTRPSGFTLGVLSAWGWNRSCVGSKPPRAAATGFPSFLLGRCQTRRPPVCYCVSELRGSFCRLTRPNGENIVTQCLHFGCLGVLGCLDSDPMFTSCLLLHFPIHIQAACLPSRGRKNKQFCLS